MNRLMGLVCLIALSGCATMRPSVTWWDGYQYVVLLRSPGDTYDVGNKLADQLRASGMTILDRDQQPGELAHEQGLETMVVSYSYNDSAIKPFFGVTLQDYTTGVLLWDNATSGL